jgi:hypothetical protein
VNSDDGVNNTRRKKERKIEKEKKRKTPHQVQEPQQIQSINKSSGVIP